MTKKSLFKQTLGVALLLLSGCDVARNARSDLARLTAADPFSPPPRPTTAMARPVAKQATPAAKPDVKTAAAAEPQGNAGADTSVNLIGKSEGDLRALLGPPTSQEDRAPGKTWHYQDGQCTVDIQLYPDVQTRQFGTLAYEVKSNDNTDEGKRVCMAQLRSRSRAQ